MAFSSRESADSNAVRATTFSACDHRTSRMARSTLSMPNVEVTGARLRTVDQRAMLPARPGTPPSWKALLATGGVKGNTDEKQHDSKHDDASENFHGYNLLISSMRRSTWRCKRKMPKPSKTTPTAARDHKTGSAVFGVEMSQPTNVISVTTIIPSQNLR